MGEVGVRFVCFLASAPGGSGIFISFLTAALVSMGVIIV